MKARLITERDPEYNEIYPPSYRSIHLPIILLQHYISLPTIGFRIVHPLVGGANPEEDHRFKDFKQVIPADKGETIKQARLYNRSLLHPLKKGTVLVFDYPLRRNLALYKLTDDILWSEDFIEVFCDCYIDLYQIERETQEYNDFTKKQISPGIFNIQGHSLGDLVLEAVYIYEENGRDYISFCIGS